MLLYIVSVMYVLDLIYNYTYGTTRIDVEKNKPIVVQEIKIFVKEENYPVYIHCAVGCTDDTSVEKLYSKFFIRLICNLHVRRRYAFAKL